MYILLILLHSTLNHPCKKNEQALSEQKSVVKRRREMDECSFVLLYLSNFSVLLFVDVLLLVGSTVHRSYQALSKFVLLFSIFELRSFPLSFITKLCIFIMIYSFYLKLLFSVLTIEINLKHL